MSIKQDTKSQGFMTSAAACVKAQNDITESSTQLLLQLAGLKASGAMKGICDNIIWTRQVSVETLKRKPFLFRVQLAAHTGK